MSLTYGQLKFLHTQLISLGVGEFPSQEITDNLYDETLLEIAQNVQLLVNGQYFKMIKNSKMLKECVFENEKLIEITKSWLFSNNNSPESFKEFINTIVETIINNIAQFSQSEDIQKTNILIVSVLFLQIFTQLNFTGPQFNFGDFSDHLGFFNEIINEYQKNEEFRDKFTKQCLQSLFIAGQQPYQLVNTPLFIILSITLFEKLQKSSISLINLDITLEPEYILSKSGIPNDLNKDSDIVEASISWWRSRAIQILLSTYHDESPILITLSFSLLAKSTVLCFINHEDVNSEINQSLLVQFYLESSRNSLAANYDTQTIDNLANAKKTSGLQFVLTGCKATFTKYQQKSTAALTILAKSSETLVRLSQNEQTESPQNIKLESDLLLERPNYVDIGDDSVFEETEKDMKRIKIDFSGNFASNEEPEEQEKKLLPIAIREELIPESLSKIDPNDQPALAALDYVQLLLRLEAIRLNTPDNDALVNEELIALVQRVLFAPSGSVNWLVYSRALWMRSLFESQRAKTVERGVLQLYSLVEELGIDNDKTARLFPKSEDEINFSKDILNDDILNTKSLPNGIRLKYVHLLPLMPRWGMDDKLAEKLTELGSLKSALEIYERLHQWIDAAVCYGAIGDETSARNLLEKRLLEDPRDARALCVLGDIEQDPKYWEQSWEIGRYANAKKSLSKYYYNPPRESGLSRNTQLAIDHMFDCLAANPLSFDNWYFYGCLGLEVENLELAAEAFTRCVAIDETSSYSWSNLASALLKMDKNQEAFNALKKAVNAGDNNKKGWRIWENYLLVAIKLGRWDDVLFASKTLLNMKRKEGQGSLDIPILEKLAELLISEPYNDESTRQTYFQKSCIDFICNQVPSVVNNSIRCWKIIAKVNIWRNKPWMALDDYEKCYRAAINNPDLTLEESAWNEAVETCVDLVSAYESLGERDGKYGAGDVVCKDWKYKAKSSVRSLMSKGKSSWEDNEGWERLQELKDELMGH